MLKLVLMESEEMRFVVVGSRPSCEKLAQSEGYCGNLSDQNAEALLIPKSIDLVKQADFLLVELGSPYLYLAQKCIALIKQIPMAYYEYEDDTVKLNTELILAYQQIIGDYYKIQTQTQGQIGYLDAAAIVINSCKHIRANQLSRLLALEVGSWTGCSSYFLAKAINSLGAQDGTLYCLDTWRGSQYWNYNVAAHIDIFANFRGYMTCFGTYDHIVPIVGEGKLGFEIMKDEYLDIIFIDGDHRYDGAYHDIYQATKKIKVGGLLMGHDCKGYAAELPTDFLLANLDKDCAFYNDTQYSCGVLKALEELFGSDYSVFGGSSTWYKVISEKDKGFTKQLPI